MSAPVTSAPIFAPWYANEQDDCIMVHGSDPDAPPCGNRVCTLPLTDQGLARGRMIAAAPDLLEALEAILSADTTSVHVGYDSGVGGGNFVYADAVRTDDEGFAKARAALAKARGEA